MSFTYLRFYKAMKSQGIDRRTFLPQLSKWQPYCAYWAAFWAPIFVLVQGYSVFLKGKWEVSTFIFSYGIVSPNPAFLSDTIAGFVWRHWPGLEDIQAHSVPQGEGCRPPHRRGVLRGTGHILPAEEGRGGSGEPQAEDSPQIVLEACSCEPGQSVVVSMVNVMVVIREWKRVMKTLHISLCQ